MKRTPEQIHAENSDWRSLLEYFQHENAVLKNCLADVLERKTVDEQKLEKAEYFQNEFLKKDEIINILRYDIHRQEKILAAKLHADGHSIPPELLHQQDKLRNNISFLRNEFIILKESFHHYLLSVK